MSRVSNSRVVFGVGMSYSQFGPNLRRASPLIPVGTVGVSIHGLQHILLGVLLLRSDASDFPRRSGTLFEFGAALVWDRLLDG